MSDVPHNDENTTPLSKFNCVVSAFHLHGPGEVTQVNDENAISHRYEQMEIIYTKTSDRVFLRYQSGIVEDVTDWSPYKIGSRINFNTSGPY